MTLITGLSGNEIYCLRRKGPVTPDHHLHFLVAG